jgi:hypothetical protein
VVVLSPWCLINIFSLSSSSSPTSLVLLNSSQVNFFSSMSIILLGIIPNPYVYILIFYQTLVRWASCPRQPTYILIFYQTLVRWASCPRQPTYILIFYQTLVGWASCLPYNYLACPITILLPQVAIYLTFDWSSCQIFWEFSTFTLSPLPGGCS